MADPATPTPRHRPAAVPARRHGLPRACRLITQTDFRRVYGRGRRAHGRRLVVVGLRRRSAGHRLGLSVSKEHGRAVRRNKLKRILREAFRLERAGLPGAFDLVVIPRAAPDHLELAEVRTELARLVAELDARRDAPPRRGRRGEGRSRRRRGGGR